MARDKTDSTFHATATNEKTLKEMANLEETLLGQLDVFGMVGLGLGATPEARRYVLLGILYEWKKDIEKNLDNLKPGRGRPKCLVSINMRRASAVLAADDFWREKTGKGNETQKAAIELAVQLERILHDSGEMEGEDRNFRTGNISRWQDSVSKGLRELGRNGERFLK